MSIADRRARAAALSLFALLAAGTPASVKAATPAVAAHIPSQDIAGALRAFARVTGQQIAFDDAVVRGKKSGPLNGRYTVETGLRALLAGTGLTFERGRTNVLIIRQKPDWRSPERSAVQSEAREAAAPSAMPTPRERESAAITDIVVTAQRRSERLSDVPISIMAQTGEQLAKAGVSSTADLTRVVPGLTFTSQAAWAQPNIRGVSTNVTGPASDNPVALYLDGIYLGNQIGSTLDLPDVERIEVLKGPQGTLFGRNATGGAIQVFTRAPSFTPTGNITATAGLFDGGGTSHSGRELGLKGYVSGPISNMLAASLSGAYNHINGYLTDDSSGKRFGEIESATIRGKLLYQPDDRTRFTLIGYYSRRTDETAQSGIALDGLTAAAGYPGAVIANQPWHASFDTFRPYLYVRTWGVSLRGEIESDAGTFTSISSYYNSTNHTRTDVDLANAPDCLLAFACLAYENRQPEEAVAQEVYFASKQDGPFGFVIGGNFYGAQGKTPSIVNDFSSPVPGFPQLVNSGPIFQSNARIKTRAYAVFGEVNYDFSDRLTAILGARYSYEKKTGYGAYTCCDSSNLPEYESKGWDNFIPRVTLKYDIDDQTNIYATYSRGFKSGVLSYSDFTAPATNPEKITAYEIGLKSASRSLTLNAAAFYYDYTDLQVLSFTGITTVTNNAASARIYGLDFDATLRLTSDFSIRGAFSWLPEAKFVRYRQATVYDLPLTAFGLTQYSRAISGSRLYKTPKLTGNVTLDYDRDIGSGRLGASVTAYYSSAFAYDASGLLNTDRYVNLSANISYAPEGTNLRFSLFGKNLTNNANVISAVPSATSAWIQYDRPREIGITGEYAF